MMNPSFDINDPWRLREVNSLMNIRLLDLLATMIYENIRINDSFTGRGFFKMKSGIYTDLIPFNELHGHIQLRYQGDNCEDYNYIIDYKDILEKFTQVILEEL